MSLRVRIEIALPQNHFHTNTASNTRQHGALVAFIWKENAKERHFGDTSPSLSVHLPMAAFFASYPLYGFLISQFFYVFLDRRLAKAGDVHQLKGRD